jgi:anti-anti-sigma factor
VTAERSTGLARIEIERNATLCLVRVLGEIDVSNAKDLSSMIQAAVPNGARGLVVDLTGTAYIDSTGVQLLFQLAERLRVRRQELTLVVPHDAPIRSVLALTGLLDVVPVEAGLPGPASAPS